MVLAAGLTLVLSSPHAMEPTPLLIAQVVASAMPLQDNVDD